jgi:hypothetical protein
MHSQIPRKRFKLYAVPCEATDAVQRRSALSRREDDGGVGPDSIRVAENFGEVFVAFPDAIDATARHMQKRIFALENLVIALLVDAPGPAGALARAMGSQPPLESAAQRHLASRTANQMQELLQESVLLRAQRQQLSS